jgi:mono/diheme cytochrome c family protein
MALRRLLLLLFVPAALASEHEGYRLLTTKPYLRPDFDQETFDQVWQAWPEPLRSRAAKATPEERRAMAFERYGLTDRGDGKPLQYVVTEGGDWVMNCFACHGGQVAGRAIPGLPNSNLALETLTVEIRRTKARLKKTFGRMDIGQYFLPLGGTHGTTNAVVFSAALTHVRDKNLGFVRKPRQPRLVHHDLDAPPWWHFRKKTRLYSDGLVEKGHRSLMQFLLVPSNGPGRFRDWERDFETIAAYLETLEPPKWPHAIDERRAARGKRVFRRHCASCHGTYGGNPSYPNREVPLDEIGTDPVRLKALSSEQRAWFRDSWFARYGKKRVVVEPKGYVAPPLDGIWASAPYLHNGSVPTLWHLLHPDSRPRVWRRSPQGYDRERVGLRVEEFDAVPQDVRDPHERRAYFDTQADSKSADGHDFPARLTEQERKDLLEYLKSL